MPALQVRNVPDSVHRRLRAKAAASGRSLSDYLLSVLERDAAALDPAEVVQRARARAEAPIAPDEIVAMIRAEREAR